MNPTNPAAADNAAISQMINGLPPAPQPSNIAGQQAPVYQPQDPGQIQPYQQQPQVPAVQQPQYQPPAPQGGGFNFDEPGGFPAVPQAPAYLPQQIAQPGQTPQAPAVQQPGQPQVPSPGSQIDPNSIPMMAPGELPSLIQQPQVPAVQQTPQYVEQLLQQNQQLIQQLAAGGTQQPNPADPNNWANNKPKDWADMQTQIQKQIQDGIAQGIQQQNEQQQQAAQIQQQQQAAQQQQADALLDAQITSLENSGYLPRIVNPGDQNDPGRLARRELYAYALTQGTDNLMAAAPTLYALHQNGYNFDVESRRLVRKHSQQAAANAPIAGAGTGVTPTGPAQGPTIQQLAGMDYSQLSDLSMQNLQ